MSSYTPLASRTSMHGPVRLCRVANDRHGISMDSAAIEVMTDLTQVNAAVTSPTATIDEANRYLVRRGVRMLLVLDDEDLLAGIVTSTDILGERPITLARERGIRHSQILIADVMTPAHRLDAFELRTVQGARVGQVVASLQRKRRHHALVTQQDDTGAIEVRGIFSLSHIARQLGTPLELPVAANSFAEVEAALAH